MSPWVNHSSGSHSGRADREPVASNTTSGSQDKTIKIWHKQHEDLRWLAYYLQAFQGDNAMSIINYLSDIAIDRAFDETLAANGGIPHDFAHFDDFGWWALALLRFAREDDGKHLGRQLEPGGACELEHERVGRSVW